MASIANARDVLLQAASERILPVALPSTVIIPALRGIRLTAPSEAFHVDAAGTASPSSITLTATLVQVTGTVSWSVTAGTATLSGSGTTRTLAYADLGSDTATIQASVTDGGTTYSAALTIGKVRDGVKGDRGDTGSPGSLTGYGAAYSISVTSWSDQKANRVIYNMLTGGSSSSNLATTDHLIIGDTVTLSNGSDFAETRFWDGSAWIAPGMVIDGNLLVNGTVAADKVTAGSIITGTSANARIKIGDISFIAGIKSPLHVEKVSAASNQTLISALNTQDDSVAIWGASAVSNGNAVSGTWHTDSAEVAAGRWQMIGILSSHLFGAAVAGNVYGSGGNFGGWFRHYTGTSSASPGSVDAEAKLATSVGGATRAGIFTGKVQLAGTGSSLMLNTDEGSSGQVLTSQGAGATPIWSTPASASVAGGSATTGGGGSTTVSTGLGSIAGFSAIALDGYVCGVSAVSGGSVTVTTRDIATHALAGGVAFRWVATP